MSGATSKRPAPDRGTLGDILGWVRRTVSGVSFWAAVVLPAVYLPLLALTRVEPAMALAGVHAAALLLGHGHRRAA